MYNYKTSLPHLQKPVIQPYPEPFESRSHLGSLFVYDSDRYHLPIYVQVSQAFSYLDVFWSNFFTDLLYRKCTRHTKHLILLYLIPLTRLGDEYKLQSPSLHNFLLCFAISPLYFSYYFFSNSVKLYVLNYGTEFQTCTCNRGNT
jgi:hypothetical protein